ncbi:acylphosphatase [Viridibacterium curvum]|uniref:acylphosphatase n=1 Tax=Viridibacterium curvum TaxID=1101404 RepID=A0ABP9R245_9RHOO
MTQRVIRRLRIRGLVQGVGYRWNMVQAANDLSLQGWVRNRSDGSVEALVGGTHADVVALIHWAGRGPAGARVESIEVEEGALAELAALGGAFAQAATL